MSRRNGPKLPAARWISSEPTAAQVTWVMRATWLALAVFVVLVFVGNHVPRG